MTKTLILTDKVIKSLFQSFTKSEILNFSSRIIDALISYSTTSERQYQPAAGVVNRPDGQKTLFRSFTSPTSGVGVKIIVSPASKPPPAPKSTLHGLLALTDDQGIPTGFINAEEVTAYRTSISAILLYLQRRSTSNIVVFGAGKQALWHIRLALALRGPEIESITIINRSTDRSKALQSQLQSENESSWKSAVTINILDYYSQSYDTDLQSLVATADVIFCTTPSTEHHFPASYLLKPDSDSNDDNNKVVSPKCYISAIGSWQSEMCELDPNLLDQSITLDSAFNPNKPPTESNNTSSSSSKGVIIVDDAETCLTHAGEITRSNLRPENLLEIGHLLHLQRHSPDENLRERITTWLSDGFVVYKSIGVSMTDLVTGNFLIDLARRRGVGVEIENF